MPVLPRSPGHLPKPVVFRTDEVMVLVNIRWWPNNPRADRVGASPPMCLIGDAQNSQQNSVRGESLRRQTDDLELLAKGVKGSRVSTLLSDRWT